MLSAIVLVFVCDQETQITKLLLSYFKLSFARIPSKSDYVLI